MRQRIEKQQETKPSETAVTVMFHGRTWVLVGHELLLASANAGASLSGELAVIRHRCFDASSPSGFVNASPERRRARSPSLSHTEKFSAEKPLACSALVGLAATPNTRGPQAVATVTTTMTEQRCCAAA